MGILLFLLKYMYISLLLKMKYGFSWPAKIMASPFKWNWLNGSGCSGMVKLMAQIGGLNLRSDQQFQCNVKLIQ